MSTIICRRLSFGYAGSATDVFTDLDLIVDTRWRSALVGRNGRGKTTLLRLLHGELPPDKGEIEVGDLGIHERLQARPFVDLSGGEQTRCLLAGLFALDSGFALIDEPTNHLDLGGRELLADYLSNKPGFLLVSHDRAFLDACADHVIALNPDTSETHRLSFSDWRSYYLQRLDEQPLWTTGDLQQQLAANHLDETRFRQIMAALGVRGSLLERPIETLSQGQRKKIELARSMMTPANLLVWDEPLNYIDIDSRERIEEVLLDEAPAMIFIEHDATFVERVATEVIELKMQENSGFE